MNVGLSFGGKMFNVDQFTDEDIKKLQSKKAASHLVSMVRLGPDGQPLHGVYEDKKLCLRQCFLHGIVYFLANKEWCNSTDPNKPDIAKEPWGTYPEIPPKFKG